MGRETERKRVSGKEEKAKRETLGKEGKKEVRIKERVELEEPEKHEKPEKLELELEMELEELEIEEIGDETEEVIRKETEWKAGTEIKPQSERNRKTETAATEAAMKVWQEENAAEEPEGRREGGNEI